MLSDDDRAALYVEIGLKVRAVRERRGLTGVAFGELLGLTHSSVNAIEQGHQSMLLHRLYQIAEILDVHTWDICSALADGSADGPWYLDADAWDEPPIMMRRA